MSTIKEGTIVVLTTEMFGGDDDLLCLGAIGEVINIFSGLPAFGWPYDVRFGLGEKGWVPLRENEFEVLE
jgi:hypothetical protein